MCANEYFFNFQDFDNPKYLSKVGNWVITFLSPKDELINLQLAITQVLPRHIGSSLQPRRVIICSTANENKWKIKSIECYDSAQMKDLVLDTQGDFSIQVLNTVMEDFKKYDIEIELLSINT